MWHLPRSLYVLFWFFSGCISGSLIYTKPPWFRVFIGVLLLCGNTAILFMHELVSMGTIGRWKDDD